MLSTIRYDGYKTIKSVSSWIILATLFLFSCFCILIIYVDSALVEFVTSSTFIESMSIIDWCVEVTEGDFLLPFSLAFSIMCISSEYSSGFIKNIYRAYKNKFFYVISKAILIVIYSVCMVIVSYVAVILICPIAFNAQFCGFSAEFVKYTLAKILYVSAFGTFSVLIGLLIRKGIIAIIVLYGYSFIVSAMLYQGINQLFVRVFQVSDFDISKYTLIGNISITNLETTWQQYLIGCGVAVVVLALCIILGSLAFKKRDC